MDIPAPIAAPATPIARAIKAAGNASRLARLLGVSPQAVDQWEAGVRPIPAARCVQIERALPGIVTRADLRPDDWRDLWPELAVQQAA